MANISEINGYLINAESASYAANGGVTQLLAGPNITLSPTNGLGQVTVSATLSGSTIFNTATGSYGSFYDTTTQTNPIANVPRSMSFNSTDITNGVSISGSTNPFNTYVKTTNAGVYNIQFSAQVDKTDSGADEIVIWLRKNGIDLTDTATTLTLSGNNDKQVAAWNWFVTSAAGDYYQIIWVSADTDLRLFAEPISGTHPGIPSVILTANRVDQFLSNTGSFSGSFNGSFTGSLFGTASWATNALTASFVNTASTNAFVQNGNSFGATALLGTNDNQSLAFETSGSTRMFINSSSGNVGIGTVTPASTLSVSGRVGISARLRVGATGDPNSTMEVWGDQTFATSAGGIWSTFVQSTERLGVGTSSPSSKVHIRGAGATSGTTALRVENTNASASIITTDDNITYLYQHGTAWQNAIFYNGSNGLDNLTLIRNNNPGNNEGYSIALKRSDGTIAAPSNVSSGRGLGLLSFSGYHTGDYRQGAIISTAVDSSALSSTSMPTRLAFSTSPSGSATSVERMRIDSSGNVGIGITSPTFRLDVSGSARITDGLTVTGSQFIFTSGSSVELRATGTGVTIGNIVTDIHTVTGSLSVSGSITSSLFGTASYATQALSASWAPGGGSTFPYTGTAQITGSLLVSGSSIISNQLTIGSSSQGPNENTLTLGARDAVNEGGQLGLNAPGGTYTSASFLDLYQDRFRILRGTNAGSTGEVATWNLQTLQMQLPAYNSATVFTGSAVAGLGVDSSGNIVTSTRTGRYGTAISGSTIGTGVTAQTIVYSQLIPANTLVAGDIIRTYYRFRKLSTNANATHNILVNTSNAVAGATTLATLTANTVHNHMKRDFYIAQGNATTSVGSAINTATDDTTNTQLLSVINWAVDQWIIYTVTLGTTDSGYGLGYSIEQVL